MGQRKISIDVFDYSGKKLCNLYDSECDTQGSANTVIATTERNGWKELSFQIPSTYMEDGVVKENYRLEYLKADYRIRTTDGNETEWYLISEPKIVHQAFSKNVSVTAGHIAQLLKVKNLGLEFSDDEGNNVGTPSTLLDTILSGTGWSKGIVDTFYEKNGTDIKYRSMKANAKTGAFKLITTMCDLFDAKPIYHGQDDRVIENYDGQGNTYYGNGRRTVDIMPINPFSEPEEGELPDVTKADGVLELSYGNNLKKIQRTLKTDNIVTKLYAYGSYGDKTDKYCGIDVGTHTEYEMDADDAVTKGKLYFFTVEDDSGVMITRCFTPSVNAAAGSKFVYSFFDPASMSYIWDSVNEKAYPVSVGMISGATCLCTSPVKKECTNWFSFLMDFSYYRKVGLMTDDMIQLLGEYQRKAPSYLEDINTASSAFITDKSAVMKTIGSVNYCKLNVAEVDTSGAYLKIKLGKTSTCPDGVIYRTDYYEKEDDYFEWNVTEKLDENGDPKNEVASMLMIVHDTEPVTWDKCYLQAIDDEEDPLWLTTWLANSSSAINLSSDRFYLFELNNINGYLGALEANDEAALLTLEKKTKTSTGTTVSHKTYFSKTAPDINKDELNGYGWWWKYADDADSEMYFCYTDEGDTAWMRVYIAADDTPIGQTGEYWYDWKKSKLYRMSGSWTELEEKTDTYISGEYNNKRVTRAMGVALTQCLTRDRLYKGVYEEWVYTAENTLPAGNYYFENGYGTDICFTTEKATKTGETITYTVSDGWITQEDEDGEKEYLDAKSKLFSSVSYHSDNLLDGSYYEDGQLDDEGAATISGGVRNANFLACIPKTEYVLTNLKYNVKIVLYDEKKYFERAIETGLSTSYTFTTLAGEKYVKLSSDYDRETFTTEKHELYAVNKDRAIIVDEDNYLRLDKENQGEVKGIIAYIDKFAELSDECFITYYEAMQEKQSLYNALTESFMNSTGDIYREGYWQKSEYVEGDEQKLYDDALENLEKIAQPEAEYSIDFVDLYGSNMDESHMSADGKQEAAAWGDLTIASAVHMIDEEADINIWAFIDKIQKCYDMPWKTNIQINTNLTTMTQHTFTDVMTNIANVANSLKGVDTRKNSTSLDVSAGTQTMLTTTTDGFTLKEGSIKLGDGESHKICAEGKIVLGKGNILLDGSAEVVKLCDTDGKVTIGENSTDDIVIGDYTISRDTADSPFGYTFSTTGDEVAVTDSGITYHAAGNVQNSGGEMDSAARTTLSNGGSGIAIYADPSTDNAVIGPENKGSLCGWDKVSGEYVNAKTVTGDVVNAAKVYMGNQLVATEKYVHDVVAGDSSFAIVKKVSCALNEQIAAGGVINVDVNASTVSGYTLLSGHLHLDSTSSNYLLAFTVSPVRRYTYNNNDLYGVTIVNNYTSALTLTGSYIFTFINDDYVTT